MKVAYWPGCVSRGFTPELHGSMAKVAPLLDIELVELDRACCSGAATTPRSRHRAESPRPRSTRSSTGSISAANRRLRIGLRLAADHQMT